MLTRCAEGLDDLCVRFIINLPPEELESVERICFQVEEAQWFYEDFIRPLDPSLPSLTLRAFSLRIFQHCPLFSQWDVQHYTTAFAEFLAYKSRVPVRGAIMLNEAMDHVVLVKGWKKGANWSFPRGKINKDEEDLDCAVREVYEETGYDVKQAGLVKDDQGTKFIEVNMREQNMRLYVFRGVPMDTRFEPKTRKEISKIEWYKLTDLPTAKKNKHQETVNESLPMHANKFYMVAPFLVPLKKWIAQQRKRDNRRSSQAHLAPPATFEETVTEDEPDLNNGDEPPPLQPAISYGPSDLPEVSVTPSYQPDPSSQLKQLLNVGGSLPPTQEANDHSSSMRRLDEPKASALLALLRQGSTVNSEPRPHTPMDQLSSSPEVPHSPHHNHPRPASFASMQPPPQFPVRPGGARPFQSQFHANQPPLFPQGDQDLFAQTQTVGRSDDNRANATSTYRQQPSAPYRQNRDPQLASILMQDLQGSSIPPASALPKLTNHTRALLDMLKTGAAVENSSVSLPSPTKTPKAFPSKPRPSEHHASSTPTLKAVAPSLDKGGFPSVSNAQKVEENTFTTSSKRPNPEHQATLLELFRKPHGGVSATKTSTTPLTASLGPVELSAQRTPRLDEKSTTSQSLPKHESLPNSREAKKNGRSSKREGQTSATVSGPLNQPQFENIIQSPRKKIVTNEFTRSPKPTGRTLFDPNRPPAVKILARPEDARHSPAQSPRGPKSTLNTATKSTARSAEPTKSFQPQILRRPQNEGLRENAQLESLATPPNASVQQKHQLPSSDYSLPSRPLVPDRQLPQGPAQNQFTDPFDPKPLLSSRPGLEDDSHRQRLLSLFTRPSAPSGPTPTSQQPLRTASPLSTSHIVNPVNENQANGVGTISTRSRVGSTASVVSGTSQALPEKRHTAAGDRAFLLDYLGRIASQEG